MILRDESGRSATMLSFRRHFHVGIYLAALAVSSTDSFAQAPQQMTMTRPWVQLKATDANGAVTYRIGGVFAEPTDANKRLSVTFVCHLGGKLTFFVVHHHVPRQTSKLTKTRFQI